MPVACGTSGAPHSGAAACMLRGGRGPAGRLPGSTVPRGFPQCSGVPWGKSRAQGGQIRRSPTSATALSTQTGLIV